MLGFARKKAKVPRIVVYPQSECKPEGGHADRSRGHISDDRLKGSVRYARVLPLGPGRTLQIEWHEEFYLGTKTAEEITFSMEARMRRILQEAGVIR
jgi:hypothetical protein